MKKGDILEGIVETVQFPNKGILHIGNKKAIIKNVIPGQKIRFRVKKNRADRIEGQLIEVIEKAPEELPEPSCVHFGVCGGCAYRNLTYEKQLGLKGEQILHLLGPDGFSVHLCGLPDPAGFVDSTGKPEGFYADGVLNVYASPVTSGHRNKMEFTFGDEYKDGPLSLGMHKQGSFYDIVNVSDCRNVDADFRAILIATRDFFAEREIPYYHRMRHDGILRHLLVRKAAASGEILVDLAAVSEAENLTEPNGGSMLEVWKDAILALPLEGNIAGILYTRNDSVADAVRDEGTTVLCGQDYFTEELLGLHFKITPFSFFQTNSRGAEVLYTQVRRMIGTLGHDPVVFDLYSGTGTIAQIIAPAAGRVIGVEIVPEAVEAARENAALNGLTNCEFLCGDVLKVLDEIPQQPDFIILDPPRDGVHPKALKKIMDYGVQQMIYISCKPTSLVRDLEILRAGGYEVSDLCCVDMFPYAAHVETVCLLGKRKSGAEAAKPDKQKEQLK